MKRLLCIFVCGLLIGCDATPGSFREAVQGIDATAPAEVQPAQTDVFDPDDPGGAGAPEDGATSKPAPEIAPETAPVAETPAETSSTPAEPISRTVDANAATRAKCERRGGRFAKTGAGLFICVNNTRDSSKSCSSSSQCEGACLARSGTCSPVTPLIGCNDILTDNGSMATVCID